MGYLINDSFIIRRTFVIPEADVLLMDSSQPYTLVTTNNNFFAIPVFSKTCSTVSPNPMAFFLGRPIFLFY